MDNAIAFIEGARVDVGGGPLLDLPGAIVNMTKDVKLCLELIDNGAQLFAADGFAHDGVEDAVGRGVGDEDVDGFGDEGPLLFEGFSSGQGKSPVHELGLPRAAVKKDAVNHDAFIFKIMSVSQKSAGFSALSLQAEFVVASDDELVLEGQAPKPIIEVFKFIEGAGVGEVSGVNEDVPGG